MLTKLGRRTGLLLATVAAALVVFSGVALALDDIIGPGGETIIEVNRPDAPNVNCAGYTCTPTTTDVGEDVYGSSGADDPVYGRGGNDWIYGRGGNDNLDGGKGNDYLYGGPGVDTLWGWEGDDYLEGGPGTDHLYGGHGGAVGKDRIYGGYDNDTVYYQNDGYVDIIDCGPGYDEVVGADSTAYGSTVNDEIANCEKVTYR